jgi:hypothetical protein
VPKRHRISITEDSELKEALARVERHFPGVPAARIVRDLAIKCAEALEREQSQSREAIERLVDVASRRSNSIDWRVLEGAGANAWGD